MLFAFFLCKIKLQSKYYSKSPNLHFIFLSKGAGFFSQYKAAFETAKRDYTNSMRASSFENNAVMRKKD